MPNQWNPTSSTETSILRFLRSLTERHGFKLTDLASEEFTLDPLKKAHAGLRSVSAGKLMALLAKAFAHNAEEAAAALHEHLQAEVDPRLVVGLLPAERLGPRSTVARALDEVVLATADAKRVEVEVEADSVVTSEELDQELAAVRALERRVLAARERIRAQATPQLQLLMGGAA